MANEELREYILRLKAEGSEEAAKSVDKVTTRLEKLRSGVTEASQRFGAASRQQDVFGDASDRMARRVDRTRDAVEDAKNSLEDLRKTAVEADQAFERADALETYEQRLRRAREQSEIYGDVASRGTALAGLAGGLGARGVGQGLYLASDIFDSIEALKRLPPELGKLAMQAGVAQLGTATLVAGLGVLGVALAGLAVGAKLLGDEAERSRLRIEAQINTIQRTAELDPLFLTTEQIQDHIEALRGENDIRKDQLIGLSALLVAEEERVGAARRFLDEIGLWNVGLDDIKDKMDELKTENEENANIILVLMDALKSSEVASNDTAEAERRLAELRTQL
ncbi:MAG TPA: hypothetical protein VK972_00810, partial [Wenzhouxiangella sp.]|nr:hypothetical protein [Wenzhouxiangella sp.]